MEKVQVDILGLSTSSTGGGAYALILKESNGNRRLPIIIGSFEAQAIALEIEGIKPPRPMTHDLLKNIIDALGCTVSEITITELKEGTFYAKVFLDNSISEEIDSRPSDAIALAVRYGAPIFVAEKVMSEASFLPENEDETSDNAPSPKAKDATLTKLEALRAQLREAIEREDYERAAQLRDDIRKIE